MACTGPVRKDWSGSCRSKKTGTDARTQLDASAVGAQGQQCSTAEGETRVREGAVKLTRNEGNATLDTKCAFSESQDDSARTLTISCDDIRVTFVNNDSKTCARAKPTWHDTPSNALYGKLKTTCSSFPLIRKAVYLRLHTTHGESGSNRRCAPHTPRVGDGSPQRQTTLTTGHNRRFTHGQQG
jgi:hypothetical protein